MTSTTVTPIPLPPLEVAPETFLIRCAQPAFGAPMSVGLNSLVIRAAEPVIVDTGPRSNREEWMRTVFTLVDPSDVRWIVLSHDDADHTGNLESVLGLCPQATLVTNWSASERMGCELAVAPERLRWVDDGDQLDLGDRTLAALRPPVYDSPCTRAFHDSSTGVLWASDAFATPMPAEPVDRVEDIPAPMWDEGMVMFHHHALAPWLSIVDRAAYANEVGRLRSLDPSVVVGAHTPVIAGAAVATALERLQALPDRSVPPHPDQAALEHALTGAS
jgi:flavorubredoxin